MGTTHDQLCETAITGIDSVRLSAGCRATMHA
jgi:hypothetical protein